MDQLEAGGVLETVERPARDVAAPERDVEAPECCLGVEALKVVALAKEGLAVAAHGGLGIALAAGDGAEAVEPPGNGGDEAPLALHIGGDGPEERRRGLVRAVGAVVAQPRDPPGARSALFAPDAKTVHELSAEAGIGL